MQKLFVQADQVYAPLDSEDFKIYSKYSKITIPTIPKGKNTRNIKSIGKLRYNIKIIPIPKTTIQINTLTHSTIKIP